MFLKFILSVVLFIITTHWYFLQVAFQMIAIDYILTEHSLLL